MSKRKYHDGFAIPYYGIFADLIIATETQILGNDTETHTYEFTSAWAPYYGPDPITRTRFLFLLHEAK